MDKIREKVVLQSGRYGLMFLYVEQGVNLA